MIAVIINVAHMKKVVLLALISLLWLGCQRGVVYSDFQQLPAQGWEADSALQLYSHKKSCRSSKRRAFLRCA